MRRVRSLKTNVQRRISVRELRQVFVDEPPALQTIINKVEEHDEREYDDDNYDERMSRSSRQSYGTL